MKCNTAPVMVASPATPYTDPDEPLRPGQKPVAYGSGNPVCFVQLVDPGSGGTFRATIPDGFDNASFIVGEQINARMDATFVQEGRQTKTKWRILGFELVKPAAPATREKAAA